MVRRKKKKKKVDKRRLKRQHLVFYLRIFDGKADRILGHLADISSYGVKLVSDAPIEEGRSYDLRMKLPKEVRGRQEFIFKAQSCWCRQDANPDFYVSGFKIDQLDTDLKERIQQLIEDFSIENNTPAGGSGRPACNLTHTTGR